MAKSSIFIAEVFRIGPLIVTNTVVVTWGIMLALGIAAWLVTKRLSVWLINWPKLLRARVKLFPSAALRRVAMR